MVDLVEYVAESIAQNPEGAAWAVTLGVPAVFYGAVGATYKVAEFLSTDADEDTGVSDDYAEGSLGTGINLALQDPSLETLDEGLERDFDIDIDQLLKRDYDEESLTEKERGILGACRAYAAKRIETSTEEYLIEKSADNHATIEGIDYSVDEELESEFNFIEESLT